MMHLPLRFFACLSLTVLFLGCSGGDSDKQGQGGGTGPEGTGGVVDRSGLKSYPDVPNVELMTEVAGIPIPRVEVEGEQLDLKAKIPADIGNPAAQDKPSKPVTGGRIVVRINSEPESMNPIVETSAVQSIMGSYVQQGLYSQNPETFEYEPMLASKWVTEDSVKLRPDYPGSERYLTIDGGEPAGQAEVVYPEAPEDAKEPPVVKVTTLGADKKPVGRAWVGLFPKEKIVGAPLNGYHFWSDADGVIEIAGVKAGTYRAQTGRELIGIVEESATAEPESEATDGDATDGEESDDKEESTADRPTIRVRPESPQNPLQEMLGDEPYLELPAADYVNVQRGTVHTFFIDERAKWSDGTPYTSKDLEFAYGVIKNPIVDGDSIRIYYEDVIRCDPLDTRVVQMQYRQQYFLAFEFTGGLSAYGPPWHLFEKALADTGKTLTLEPLTPEQETAQKKVSVHGAEFGRFFNGYVPYNTKPLGTGPYVIEDWKDTEKIVLKRNPNYWTDKYRGYLDEIVFRFITEDITALRALEGGEIDFLYRMTAEQAYEDLAGPPEWFAKNYVKSSWYIPSFSYLGWNLRKPLFQDRKVRIALGLLLDLQEFLEKKVYNEGVLVSGSPYYFAPAYDHDVKPLGYDPEAARDLLSEAGWTDTNNDGVLDKDGQPFEFTLMIVPGSKVTDAFAAIMQESFKQAGIKVNIDRLEWASFIEKIRAKDFDVVRLGWVSPIESDPYQIWHSSGAGPESRSSNHVSFANPVADELIEMVRVTLDKEKRNAIFHSFHRLLDSEQPYTFLYTPKDFGAYHQRYRGVKWYRIRPGFDLTEWYVPKDLQRQ